MPHFVIDCSNTIVESQAPEVVMQAVHESAFSTGLFTEDDIKVRINPYAQYGGREKR